MSSSPESNPLHLYAAYPFTTDEEYQQGLASIISGGALDAAGDSEELKDEIIRRTRVFYFNRKTGNDLSMDDARAYEHALRGINSSQEATPDSPSENDYSEEMDALSDGDESEPESEVPETLTLTQLKDLIESGKVDQIPNNKIIPEGVNDAPPSESTAVPRRKPWEVPVEGADATTTTTSEVTANA